jgi:hypothetical protein
MDSAANAASRPAQYVRHNTCGYCGNIGYDHKNCGFSTRTDCGTSLPDLQTNGKHFGSKCDVRAEQRTSESQTTGAKLSHDGKGKQHGRLDLHAPVADVTSVVIETFNKEPLGALLYYATRLRPDISTRRDLVRGHSHREAYGRYRQRTGASSCRCHHRCHGKLKQEGKTCTSIKYYH